MSEFAAIILPGMMLMWVFFIAQNGMNDIFIEHDKTTLRRMYSSTLTIQEIIISKMLYCFMLCSIAELLMIMGAWFLFGVNWGNVFALGAIFFSCNLAFVGVMVLIFSLSKTRESASGLSAIVILLFALVGGGMMPYIVMPKFMQQIADFSLIRWGALAIESMMDGQDFVDILSPVMKLLAAGTISLGIGSWIFKRRIESGEL